ncbi:phage/plasmid primase, P4 family [Shewanella sp.]|uniref:phage/plasmid primase, P4 family n=1 Tax=Shewanella sp. TaxID=50422 RepID=UPI004048E61F
MNHPSVLFLNHLDSSATGRFNIEHLTDMPKGEKRPKPDPLQGRYANLTRQQVEELIPQLQARNEEGAAIYIARNEFNGHRKLRTLSRVRGVHADMDDVSATQLADLIGLLQPSIVVESSPGRCQLYWQLSEGAYLEAAEAKAINQCLASRYGADPAAVDVARLLRLPGFKHMKYRSEGRTPMVTAVCHGIAYTAEEIRQAFPCTPSANKVPTKPLQTVLSSTPRKQLPSHLAGIAQSVAITHPQLWTGEWANAIRASGEIGYPSQSEADLALAGHIIRECRRSSISEESLAEAVEALFSSAPVGMTGKWQERPDYRTRTISKAVSGTQVVVNTNPLNGLVLQSHGDIRNAKAFAEVARGQFLYVATRDRWLSWSQDKWRLCEKDEHVAMAKEVCGQILNAANDVFRQHQERGKRLIQEAMAAHNLSRITAMLKLAVSEPDMAITDRELDGDPYLIGVSNGVIDLRTGMHPPNRPDFRITRYCNAQYDADSKCDRWLTFLNQIFKGDVETIHCVQRLLGCTLLGLSNEEILIICYGHGSNGKSVFSNVIHHIMGEYSVTAPPSLLTARRQDDTGPRNDLAALAGARYVSINEMQAGDRLDEQIVKMLAGREPISARFLHQEYFEFMPSFTPWLRTNHKPIITGLDDGIWRRLVLLPFEQKFEGDSKDPNLEQRLLAERDGILMWMVEGAKLYLQSGICMSPRMFIEMATYRTESDLLGEFLSDKTTPCLDGKISQGTLYTRYREWCLDCGVRPLSKKTFTQRLAERGYPEGKSGKDRFYLGLVCQGC